MKSDNPFEVLNSRLDEIFNRLDEIQNSKDDSRDVEESKIILNVREAAELLNLSVYSIYAKTSKKEIPFSKRGRHLYFFRGDLIDWLRKAAFKTKDQIEQEAHDVLLNQKHRPAKRYKV